LLDQLQIAREEITTLRLKTADKHGEYDDYTPLSFGQHKGEQLKDVPEEYLLWWWEQNQDRGTIILEMDFGTWPQRMGAVKRLRLHDYCKRRFNGQDIQQTGSQT